MALVQSGLQMKHQTSCIPAFYGSLLTPPDTPPHEPEQEEATGMEWEKSVVYCPKVFVKKYKTMPLPTPASSDTELEEEKMEESQFYKLMTLPPAMFSRLLSSVESSLQQKKASHPVTVSSSPTFEFDDLGSKILDTINEPSSPGRTSPVSSHDPSCCLRPICMQCDSVLSIDCPVSSVGQVKSVAEELKLTNVTEYDLPLLNALLQAERAALSKWLETKANGGIFNPTLSAINSRLPFVGANVAYKGGKPYKEEEDAGEQVSTAKKLATDQSQAESARRQRLAFTSKKQKQNTAHRQRKQRNVKLAVNQRAEAPKSPTEVQQQQPLSTAEVVVNVVTSSKSSGATPEVKIHQTFHVSDHHNYSAPADHHNYTKPSQHQGPPPALTQKSSCGVVVVQEPNGMQNVTTPNYVSSSPVPSSRKVSLDLEPPEPPKQTGQQREFRRSKNYKSERTRDGCKSEERKRRHRENEQLRRAKSRDLMQELEADIKVISPSTLGGKNWPKRVVLTAAQKLFQELYVSNKKASVDIENQYNAVMSLLSQTRCSHLKQNYLEELDSIKVHIDRYSKFVRDIKS